jgi:hypothetical protein
MARALTQVQLDTVRGWLARAERRLDGAEVAARRPHPSEGEFDNNFDGVVTAIFHTVDAFELVRTGVHRRADEGEEATLIRSVISSLRAANTPGVPAPERLIDLNHRRNTSVHGEWMEVLDPEALSDAIMAARAFLSAVKIWMVRGGIRP